MKETESYEKRNKYFFIDDLLYNELTEIDLLTDKYLFLPQIIKKSKTNSEAYCAIVQSVNETGSSTIPNLQVIELYKEDMIKAYNSGKYVKNIEEIADVVESLIDLKKSEFWTYIHKAIEKGRIGYSGILDEEKQYKEDIKKIFTTGLKNSKHCKQTKKHKNTKKESKLKALIIAGMFFVTTTIGGIYAILKYSINEFQQEPMKIETIEKKYLPIVQEVLDGFSERIEEQTRKSIEEFIKENPDYFLSEEDIKKTLIDILKNEETAQLLAEAFKKAFFKN